MISNNNTPTTHNDLKQQYTYHTQWSHTAIHLPHTMISYSTTSTRHNDLIHHYIYHTQRWSYTAIHLPYTMISHSDTPTTHNDLAQQYTYHTQWWSRTAIQASHTLQWPARGGRLNEHDVHQLISLPPEHTEVSHMSHLTEQCKVVNRNHWNQMETWHQSLSAQFMSAHTLWWSPACYFPFSPRICTKAHKANRVKEMKNKIMKTKHIRAKRKKKRQKQNMDSSFSCFRQSWLGM